MHQFAKQCADSLALRFLKRDCRYYLPSCDAPVLVYQRCVLVADGAGEPRLAVLHEHRKQVPCEAAGTAQDRFDSSVLHPSGNMRRLDQRSEIFVPDRPSDEFEVVTPTFD